MQSEVPLAFMTRGTFRALDDESLARATVEPIVAVVRGRSPAVKAAVYDALPQGRRALLMFWIVYGHAGRVGWTRFFGEVPYVAVFPQFFECLRAAFEHFGDDAMFELVGDVERVYRDHELASIDLSALAGRRATQAAVVEALAPLDRRYTALAPAALRRVAARIRERTHEFIALQS